MAKSTKTAWKPKPVPPVSIPVVDPVDKAADKVVATARTYEEAMNDYIVAVQSRGPKHPLSQAAVLAAKVINSVSSFSEKAYEKVRGAMLDFRNMGGEFVAGKVGVVISSTSRVTPKWKDEAINLARQNHTLRAWCESRGVGLPDDSFVPDSLFVPSVFEDAVVKRTPATKKDSLTITVSD